MLTMYFAEDFILGCIWRLVSWDRLSLEEEGLPTWATEVGWS